MSIFHNMTLFLKVKSFSFITAKHTRVDIIALFTPSLHVIIMFSSQISNELVP